MVLCGIKVVGLCAHVIDGGAVDRLECLSLVPQRDSKVSLLTSTHLCFHVEEGGLCSARSSLFLQEIGCQ